jgi:hypothetical protein
MTRRVNLLTGAFHPRPRNIEEITKFNLQIHLVSLQRIILRETYRYDENIAPIKTVRGHLHRIRGRASDFYMEYSIAGLWNAVNNNQRMSSSSKDERKFYYLCPANESMVNRDSGVDARVQAFASTDALLRHAADLEQIAFKMQLVIDSKYRVILNNYPAFWMQARSFI